MDIIACGGKVKTKIANIDGQITGISIKFVSVLYEITYYANGKFETTFMNEGEFDLTDGNRCTLGFIK